MTLDQEKKNPKSKTNPGITITKCADPALYKYDKNAKSWTGTPRGKHEVHQITKILRNKEKQIRKQDPDTLEHNRKRAEKHLDPDLDEDSDTYSISINVHKEVPSIQKPFEADKTNNNKVISKANWSTPDTPSRSRPEFERPSASNNVQSSINSRTHQITLLEKQLDQKENDLEMMRTQLFKSHRENMKLVNALSQCSGHKYGDVIRENAVLKEQNERLTKQITKMWGNQIKDSNSVLKRIEYEEELEAKKMKEFTSARSPRK